MKFNWDPAKARTNLAKHGVSFEEASTVFYDQFELSRRDEAHSTGEDRWITIGLSYRLRALVVISTERDDEMVWIISARKANRVEVNRYEEARKRRSRG